jgi:Small integral membrane protein
MISAVRIYFVVFGILTIAGGIIGYVSKGSVPSIIAGSVSGILLLVSAFLLPRNPAAGLIMAALISLLLAGQFLPKLIRTGQMMPAGIMSALSILGIIAVIAAWAGK